MRYERKNRYKKNGKKTGRRWLEDFAAAAAGGIAAVFLFTAMETMGSFSGTDAAENPIVVENPAVMENSTAAENQLPSLILVMAKNQLAAGNQTVSGKKTVSASQDLSFQTAETDPDHPLIMIDPGHGGTDEGSYAGGILEKDINMEIAKKLRECLEEAGYRVLMTRCSDTYLTKEQRAEAANVSGAEAFVSIHQNTYEDGEPSGIETWYDGTDQSRDSRRLAQLIHGEAVKRTGARERQLR